MNKVIINNTLVVSPKGEIDHNNSAILRNEIDKEVKQRPIKNIIFDLKALDFMDSSGIGMILGRYKLISGLNGKIMITSPQNSILKIINVSGLNKIIPIYESVNDALESVNEVAYNG
jgi:stage II sporulation protein AA (anti-sigma F factor antagonist)